jgi:hypothetical protein
LKWEGERELAGDALWCFWRRLGEDEEDAIGTSLYTRERGTKKRLAGGVIIGHRRWGPDASWRLPKRSS